MTCRVDSKDAAIAAIEAQVPDLILLTALLSPRDEEELVRHLRQLKRADHLQTLTIPQLASSPAPSTERRAGRRLFGGLTRVSRRATVGCDLDAEEVSVCTPASPEERPALDEAAVTPEIEAAGLELPPDSGVAELVEEEPEEAPTAMSAEATAWPRTCSCGTPFALRTPRSRGRSKKS